MNYNIINTTRALQPVNDMSTKNKLWKDTQQTTDSAYSEEWELRGKRGNFNILLKTPKYNLKLSC